MKLALPDAHITAVLGPDMEPESYTVAGGTAAGVTFVGGTTLMSEHMVQADLAVTSCGRTVLELIRCGTPTVAFAVNANEMKHQSASWSYGIVNGGYGPSMTLDNMARHMTEAARLQTRERARSLMDSVHFTNPFWELVLHKYRMRTQSRKLVPA